MAYTYSQLLSRINGGIKGKIGVLVDARETINQVVREVVSDTDLRSAIRKTALTPNLFTNIFEYACPTDMKGQAIIDIKPQTDRTQKEYILTTEEEFMVRKDPNSIAFSDNDMLRKILVNTAVSDESIVLSRLDAVESWVAFGDAENIERDIHNYVRENASLKFDISAAAGTTAGVQNSSLTTFDLTDFLGATGSVFVWVYITSTTGLTNFILRLGSSSGDYYQKTITTASDGTAFQTGWNLLRFDLTSLTTVGTPDNDAGAYAAIYMTKETSKVSESDYAFDSLVLKKGEKNNIFYYSKYGWKTSGGTYIENSTVVSDILNVDTDEFDMIVEKGIAVAGMEVDEVDAATRAASRYSDKKVTYESRNPSRAKNIMQTYADFINSS